MATYTVKKGDTLSEIAERYKSNYGYSSTYAYVDRLVELNNIKDPDYIVVGQVIKLDGEASKPKTNASSKATIDVFGLQSNTDRTVYVTWTWSKNNTENYQVIWYYDTGDSVWFVGNDGTAKDKQSLYSAPANALRVRVKIKPVSQTHTVNDKEVHYWTAGWSTFVTYSFSDNPPTTPSTPTVNIKDLTLTTELHNLDVNGSEIEFQVVKDNKSVFKTGKAEIITSSAVYSCPVNAGSEYKVRCRSVRGKLYSDWSDYSASVGTAPSVPTGITVCRATSETSVYLEWDAVSNATTYDVEYTTKKTYFDGSDQTTPINGIAFTHYEKTGLTSGEEYFFRVRAVNDDGHSGWSTISSVKIGKAPVAPTTWSSTTTAITGEPLTLYWVHNAEDDSKQTYAEIELTVDKYTETKTIRDNNTEEDEEQTSSYSVDTSSYVEGTKLLWRVRTAGITNEYGDWSIQRTVDIYAPPTLELNMIDQKGNSIEILESYPFYVSGIAGPKTQIPIGYHVVITANTSYDTVDNFGNEKTVSQGEEVYSKYFDISEELMVEFSASNLSLENNADYTLTVTAHMNSGLTKSESKEFIVAWEEEEFEPNAEIGIDENSYTAYIRPFCKNIYGHLIEGVTLSVYRREFDGGFTELGKDLENTRNTFITDPHPALDFARYRVVAKTIDTGKISYYDVPGYPVGCSSVIVQWNEEWTGFDVSEEAELEQRPWTGSLLELPYNIDVSDSFKPDTALIEYIGRRHPVSYYGTHIGSTSTWSMQIPKYDKETLYGLRRLASWMGDVYVREPSGSGYWANVVVSFSQKHLDVTIPVTLSITRVAGGA